MNWFRRIPKWVMAVMLFGVSGSFIFWGIPSVFSFTGQKPMIRVGETKIYAQDFQQEFDRFLKERGGQENRTISTEEGRTLGLDVVARDRLVTRLLMEQKARELGLAISRNQVVDELKTVPSLSDGHGGIDPDRWAQVLQNNQISEGAFIGQIASDMVQRQLYGTVLADVALPPEYIRALQHFRLERRVAEYVLIDPARAGEIKDPGDAALTAYYSAHIAQFSAPEYRAVTIASTSAKEIGAAMEIKDDEIKKLYEARIDQYQTPEKRVLEQIQFPTEAKARAARAELAAGKFFEDVAKEAGYKPEDIKLGEVAATDKSVPAVAFTTELMKPSDPVKGTFGWLILRATASTPGTVKKLEEVRPELREAIVTERAKDEASKLSIKYEEARGGGKSIEDAAKDFKLKVTKIAAIDKSGKNEAGQTVDNLPVGAAMLAQIFAADSGGESELQETDDAVYYQFRVDSVKPAAQKPFASVRNDVLTMWRAEQQHQKLQAIADDLVKRGKSGQTMAQIASSLGVAALKSDPLPRMPATTVFSDAALTALFDTKVGGFFSGPVADGKSIVVARVDSSAQKAEDPNAPEVGMYLQVLNQSFTGDIAVQFTAALRRDSCSQKTLWERVFGTTLKDCVDEAQFARANAGQ